MIKLITYTPNYFSSLYLFLQKNMPKKPLDIFIKVKKILLVKSSIENQNKIFATISLCVLYLFVLNGHKNLIFLLFIRYLYLLLIE